MFVVIAYDIPNNKRRTKIMKVLQGYGAHVQKSVFECALKRGVYRQLRHRLKTLINVEEDNVRFYHLCQADVRRIEALGVGREVQQICAYRVV